MHIVLVEPKIPQNTGSIARTCAATQTPLHLVGELGFDISEKAVRRAGLDYWPHVELHQHSSWESYLGSEKPERFWLISKFGDASYTEVKYESGDALVFGDEVKGLGKEFLAKTPHRVLRIPMSSPDVRSLNLSNAVAVVLYEARRQLEIN